VLISLLVPIKEHCREFLREDLRVFYGHISWNKAHFPSTFATQFEIDRLRLSKHARLKKVSGGQNEMILGTLIVLKIFLFKIVLQAHTHCKVKPVGVVKVNLMTIGSIIYRIVMEYFLGRVEMMPERERCELDRRLRMDAMTTLVPEILEDYENGVLRENASEVINGMYGRKELKLFFESSGYKEVRTVVEGWVKGVSKGFLEGLGKKGKVLKG